MWFMRQAGRSLPEYREIRRRHAFFEINQSAELTAEVQPRVFEEQFPNRILYVGDVIPGNVTRWRNVFIADLTPADERTKKEDHDRGEGPRITVASDAIAVPDVLQPYMGGLKVVEKDG